MESWLGLGELRKADLKKAEFHSDYKTTQKLLKNETT